MDESICTSSQVHFTLYTYSPINCWTDLGMAFFSTSLRHSSRMQVKELSRRSTSGGGVNLTLEVDTASFQFASPRLIFSSNQGARPWPSGDGGLTWSELPAFLLAADKHSNAKGQLEWAARLPCAGALGWVGHLTRDVCSLSGASVLSLNVSGFVWSRRRRRGRWWRTSS